MHIHFLSRLNSKHSPTNCRKWESHNRLHTSTPGKKKSSNPMHLLKVETALQSQHTSTKTIGPIFFPSSSILPFQSKSRALNSTIPFHTKYNSCLSIEDLLMLEEDLFTIKPHIKPQHKDTVKLAKEKPMPIQLKGIKINVTPHKVHESKCPRPMSNRSCLRVAQNPIIYNKRACSVNKTSEKRKRHDTPGPWDNEKSAENIGNTQNSQEWKEKDHIIISINEQKFIEVQDECTST